MAEQNSPTVEIAPTVIVSNSNEEGTDNDHANSTDDNGEGSGTAELSSHDNGNATDGTSPIVAVAEIEAERDVTLAAIHDETERERLRLEAERVAAIEDSNREYTECQREIQELRERVETLTALLIPPQPLEEMVTEEPLEIAEETNLTPPSTAAPTVETLTEPSEESVEESQVTEAAPSRARKYVAI